MRVVSMYPEMQYAIQQSEQSLSGALQQVSTGKRVSQLSDDPSASADMVRSLADSADVDQYTANVSSLQSRLQTADSALSSVVTALNQAVSLGTEGASDALDTANRQAVAAQVQSILGTVVSLANTSSQGSYLFAGSAVSKAPFTADSTAESGYIYNGNDTVNRVQVGQSLSVSANMPGDQIFTAGANVLGSLSSLVTALNSGDTTQIAVASTAISSSLNYVDQQRASLDNTLSQLSAQESSLGQESISLSDQQSSLTGIDLAEAATNLTEAETEHSAVLAATAKISSATLLDYLK
jgi:flagellar hook-associated protein 3 FlgL